MIKLDQEATYRHVPVRKEDLHLQFVKWGDKHFQETKLMFGGTTSPGIYNRFPGLFLVPLRPEDQRNGSQGCSPLPR